MLFSLISICFGHSGGLDAYGCHSGSQPYHCHGTYQNTTTTYKNPVDTHTDCTSKIENLEYDLRYCQHDLQNLEDWKQYKYEEYSKHLDELAEKIAPLEAENNYLNNISKALEIENNNLKVELQSSEYMVERLLLENETLRKDYETALECKSLQSEVMRLNKLYALYTEVDEKQYQKKKQRQERQERRNEFTYFVLTRGSVVIITGILVSPFVYILAKNPLTPTQIDEY